jgi:hypothetical protein
MNLSELVQDVQIMLRQFRVEYRRMEVLRGISSQYFVEDFGLIVCCVQVANRKQLVTKLGNDFEDWRRVFITERDNLLEKKYEVLWDLMRGGYMRWLRINYPRQVKNTLLGPENLGNRIIQERLRVWNDKPMFKFLIDDNKEALRGGINNEVMRDPSFFDYMPEQ